MKVVSFLFIVAVAVHQTSAEAVKCSNGIDMCNGCQCCPDGKICPNGASCPFKCPNDDNPVDPSHGKCSDGLTQCEPCQCCPDGRKCPNSAACPSKCPKDDDGPDPTKNPTTEGVCRDGTTKCDPKTCGCCPDGRSCPGTSGCPKCPKDDDTPDVSTSPRTTKSTTPKSTTPKKTTTRKTSSTTTTEAPPEEPTTEEDETTEEPETTESDETLEPVTSEDETTEEPINPETDEPVLTEHRITFRNKCPHDVWVGALNNPGKLLPQKGGWYMEKGGEAYKITVPPGWAGRFWGRTACAETANGKFQCVTGDCAHRRECNGAGGEPPATFAEFIMDKPESDGADSFDVSLVDGYNLPIAIKPVAGSHLPDFDKCIQSGCKMDLNMFCLADLRVTKDEKTVGCQSPCVAFNDDQYCCQGDYDCSKYADECDDGLTQCDPVKWPVNYSQIFKMACPTAFAYIYDDPSNIFTCTGKPYTHYEVIFCPQNNHA